MALVCGSLRSCGSWVQMDKLSLDLRRRNLSSKGEHPIDAKSRASPMPPIRIGMHLRTRIQQDRLNRTKKIWTQSKSLKSVWPFV